MRLNELIKRRLAINEEQIESLEQILFLNKRKSEKQKIRSILKSMQLYIVFEDTDFAKEIEMLPFGVSWETNEHKKNKLKEIQKVLLGK